MANIVTIEANKLLASSVTGAAYVGPSGAVNLSLFTTATASTATTPGTEVTGGSYARQATTGLWGTASASAITTTGAISFTGMPLVTSVNGIELWDSAGTPVRRWFGTILAPKATNVGDTISFAAGSIIIGLT
jgi:hypothetical protein